MKKKGFTLVELLAVIVILAIIALIAVPIIMNVVESSRKGAATSSAYGYIKGVNITYANELLLGNNFELEGTLLVDENGNINGHKVDVEGTTIKGGYLTYNNGKITEGCLTIGNYKVTIENDVAKETIKGACEGKASKIVKFDNETSWGDIIEAVRNGNTEGMKVGDTKEVTLTSEDEEIVGTYTLRIANTSTPNKCSQEDFSQTACGFVVEFEDIITIRKMNTQDTNYGGWEASEIRKYLNVIEEEADSGTIYNALPNDLKVGIIDTKVISGRGINNGDNFTTTDKLYLLSPHEVLENGTDNTIDYDAAWNNTRQLDYYLNKGVTTDDYSETKKYYDSTATFWWLRDPYINNYNYFYGVPGDGNWNIDSAPTTNGVSPAFRIG